MQGKAEHCLALLQFFACITRAINSNTTATHPITYSNFYNTHVILLQRDASCAAANG